MSLYLSYQDFEKESDKMGFLVRLLSYHRGSPEFLTAITADAYDRQLNTTICSFTKVYYDILGFEHKDSYSSNARLASNIFSRLNTQRCTYSLGNGVTFTKDGTKERLGLDKAGYDFDTRLMTAGYYALIHSCSYIFYNRDHIHVFKYPEFAPLYDEETSALRAGLYWWQIHPEKPIHAIFYEEDGYTRLIGDCKGGTFKVEAEKAAYKTTIRKAPADAEPEVISAENYGRLPIVPLWGSKRHQSTLIGMRDKIDAIDLVRSGFVNDVADCAEVYWILEHSGGMEMDDLAKFRDKLKMFHMVDSDDADSVKPYTQDIPTEARTKLLDDLRSSIYEDFGGLDVHAVAAGSTNDHIDAAYQPMDENADDFEGQIIIAIGAILDLIGVNDTPQFKRNRISNQKEQVDMILAAAEYLDEETVLKKLPFITPEEVPEIMKRKEEEQIDLSAEDEPESVAYDKGSGAEDEETGANSSESAAEEE